MPAQVHVTVVPMVADQPHSLDGILSEAIDILTSAQDVFEFERAEQSITLSSPDIDDRHSWQSLNDLLVQANGPSDGSVLLGVLDQPIEKNYFLHVSPDIRVGFITTNQWASISDLPVKLQVAISIADATAMALVPGWKSHKDPRGCLGDFCKVKKDKVQKIRNGAICDECRAVLEPGLGSERFEALENMLRAISARAAI
jgi:hypothetical protein